MRMQFTNTGEPLRVFWDRGLAGMAMVGISNCAMARFIYFRNPGMGKRRLVERSLASAMEEVRPSILSVMSEGL